MLSDNAKALSFQWLHWGEGSVQPESAAAGSLEPLLHPSPCPLAAFLSLLAAELTPPLLPPSAMGSSGAAVANSKGICCLT